METQGQTLNLIWKQPQVESPKEEPFPTTVAQGNKGVVAKNSQTNIEVIATPSTPAHIDSKTKETPSLQITNSRETTYKSETKTNMKTSLAGVVGESQVSLIETE